PMNAVMKPAESARICFYRNPKASTASPQPSLAYYIRLREGCTQPALARLCGPWGLCRIGRHAWARMAANFHFGMSLQPTGFPPNLLSPSASLHKESLCYDGEL